MKIKVRKNTGRHNLVMTDIHEKLYFEDSQGDQLWVTTSYGQLKVGLPGGAIYHIYDGKLVSTKERVGVKSAKKKK